MFCDLQEEKKEVAALTAGESWEDKLKQVNCWGCAHLSAWCECMVDTLSWTFRSKVYIVDKLFWYYLYICKSMWDYNRTSQVFGGKPTPPEALIC